MILNILYEFLFHNEIKSAIEGCGYGSRLDCMQTRILCLCMYVWSSGLLRGFVQLYYAIRIPFVHDAFFLSFLYLI